MANDCVSERAHQWRQLAGSASDARWLNRFIGDEAAATFGQRDDKSTRGAGMPHRAITTRRAKVLSMALGSISRTAGDHPRARSQLDNRVESKRCAARPSGACARQTRHKMLRLKRQDPSDPSPWARVRRTARRGPADDPEITFHTDRDPRSTAYAPAWRRLRWQGRALSG